MNANKLKSLNGILNHSYDQFEKKLNLLCWFVELKIDIDQKPFTDDIYYL